jgi:hypothetical protein
VRRKHEIELDDTPNRTRGKHRHHHDTQGAQAPRDNQKADVSEAHDVHDKEHDHEPHPASANLDNNTRQHDIDHPHHNDDLNDTDQHYPRIHAPDPRDARR